MERAAWRRSSHPSIWQREFVGEGRIPFVVIDPELRQSGIVGNAGPELRGLQGCGRECLRYDRRSDPHRWPVGCSRENRAVESESRPNRVDEPEVVTVRLRLRARSARAWRDESRRRRDRARRVLAIGLPLSEGAIEVAYYVELGGSG